MRSFTSFSSPVTSSSTVRMRSRYATARYDVIISASTPVSERSSFFSPPPANPPARR